MFKDLLKKEKINKVYSYKEIKTGNTIEFGWEETEDLDGDSFIVSYSSKARSVGEKDRDWSKNEGKNIASTSHYRSYFQALTGYEVDEFISEWGSNLEELEEYWRSRSSSYREGEGSFLLSLAKIIEEDDSKGFTMFGRIFRKLKI